MTIAILGASGMLGSAVFREISAQSELAAVGVARSNAAQVHFPGLPKLFTGVDVENFDQLVSLLRSLRPSIVINCVGIVKQLAEANDPLIALPINSIFPHRLARLCDLLGARLIHISTDCVFSGRQGMYRETDYPDASDLYGRSKLLGEVDYSNAITIRTSIIGRELNSRNGLVEWFLSQTGTVRGFTRAIFSGLTTKELAGVILHKVIPRPELHGVYHVSAKPIDKFQLLGMLKDIYRKDVNIQADDKVVIDRSLDSTNFTTRTGYVAPSWDEMLRSMADDR